MSETATATQTLGFKAEVRELLKLMIHSLYSHREIFLRELISNASDANDKLRFLALATPTLPGEERELGIWIEADEKAGTISIRDNGIGMTRDEAVAHLGTIAKSGTAEFFGKLTGDAQKDSALIGQFGVGFYSAFIVADKVEVRSRRAGEPTRAACAGNRRQWRVHGGNRRARRARHHRHPAPEGRRKGIRRQLAPALAGASLFRPPVVPGVHAEAGRLFGRAFNDVQTAASKSVDAGPRSAQISESQLCARLSRRR